MNESIGLSALPSLALRAARLQVWIGPWPCPDCSCFSSSENCKPAFFKRIIDTFSFVFRNIFQLSDFGALKGIVDAQVTNSLVYTFAHRKISEDTKN